MKLYSFSWCITLIALTTLTINANHEKPYNPRVNAKIVAGFEHSLVIDGGQVLAWGSNKNALAGFTSAEYQPTPTLIDGLENIIALAQGSAANHALALRLDGTVWAWGDNENGQLGVGNDEIINTSKPMMVKELYGAVAIAAGKSHSIALKDDGSVWTWGDNSFGQLGHIVQKNSLAPKRIHGLNNVVAVSAGYHHSVALKKDGTVWTWGKNLNGQLGLGNNETFSKPIQIPNLTDVVYITSGASHCIALKGDGSVWAWGWNDYGQLGDGTFISRNSPIQINKAEKIVRISAGGLHSVALNTSGEVYAWGANTFGQLGKSSFRNYAVPVKVFSLKNIVSVDAGDMHSLAIKSDGTVFSWGSNSNYQLGENEELSSSTALAVTKITDLPTALTALNNETPAILPIENKYEPINEDLVEKDLAINSIGNRMKGPNEAVEVEEEETDEYAVPNSFGLVEEECPTEATLKVINLNVFCTEEANTNLLRWKAPLDIMSLEFEVQKSIDNQTWIALDVTPGIQENKNYFQLSAKDKSASGQKVFYRLRQINCNSEDKYSAIAALKCGNETDEQNMTLQPELAHDYFLLTLTEGIDKGYKYEIIDSDNRVVFSEKIEQSANAQSLTISAKLLKGGLHVLRVISKNGKEVIFTKKLFKVND